jgi:hypothetical protein
MSQGDIVANKSERTAVTRNRTCCPRPLLTGGVIEPSLPSRLPPRLPTPAPALARTPQSPSALLQSTADMVSRHITLLGTCGPRPRRLASSRSHAVLPPPQPRPSSSIRASIPTQGSLHLCRSRAICSVMMRPSAPQYTTARGFPRNNIHHRRVRMCLAWVEPSCRFRYPERHGRDAFARSSIRFLVDIAYATKNIRVWWSSRWESHAHGQKARVLAWHLAACSFDLPRGAQLSRYLLLSSLSFFGLIPNCTLRSCCKSCDTSYRASDIRSSKGAFVLPSPHRRYLHKSSLI